MASGIFTPASLGITLLCQCPQAQAPDPLHVTNPSNTGRCSPAIFSCLGLSWDCSQVTAGLQPPVSPDRLDIHGGPGTWQQVMSALAVSSSEHLLMASPRASVQGNSEGSFLQPRGHGATSFAVFGGRKPTSPPRIKRWFLDAPVNAKRSACQTTAKYRQINEHLSRARHWAKSIYMMT